MQQITQACSFTLLQNEPDIRQHVHFILLVLLFLILLLKTIIDQGHLLPSPRMIILFFGTTIMRFGYIIAGLGTFSNE
jgi:hypothetical protein